MRGRRQSAPRGGFGYVRTSQLEALLSCCACGHEIDDSGDHDLHCPKRRTDRWPSGPENPQRLLRDPAVALRDSGVGRSATCIERQA
jgi:hypothetical protein